MPDQTPATELRRAARYLRGAATADYVTPGPWIVHEAYGFLRVDNDRDKTREAWTVKTGADLADENRPTAEYIALMHPGVGVALARWLKGAARAHEATVQAAAQVFGDDETARDEWIAKQTNGEALAVARAILGQVTP